MSSYRKQTWSSKVIFVLVILILDPPGIVHGEDVIYPLTQPQIYIKDGHIFFVPAEHKNLVLKANGRGKILFNSVELGNLIESVQNSSRDLNAFKGAFGVPSSSSGQISSRVSNIEQTVQRLSQIETLDGRLTRIEQRLSTNNGSDPADSRINNRLRRLRSRVDAIENQLRGVGTSAQSPCSNNPCTNGGTCIPTIYGAFCYCSQGWEGERCNLDVNECNNFAGTELGCQNGATCVNRPGTYTCQCRSGYVGLHCSKRSGDCSSGSTWELCGHGVCVNQHSGSNPFTCICDAGWTQDSRTRACSVDIDECSQYQTTCSVNPTVACINTPGSFVCGPCPAGYTGNGHQCADINECLVNNGGCSINPMVQCTNTMGSKSCGPCPPGYMGNGFSCQYVGMCHMNNGGCYPSARCVDNPMIGQSFVQCICPAGYTGTGMGLHGCIPYGQGGGTGVGPTLPPGGNFCTPNPCQNGGICHSYGVTFSCSCMPGFVGQTCSTRANPCLSQPCQNGGTCQSTATGFTCTCSSGYLGDVCERQAESCGGYVAELQGSIKYPQTQSVYAVNASCEWMLHTSPGKVFNITFTSFHLEGGRGDFCPYDYLEFRDGSDGTSPLLGRYCGDTLPGGGHLISSHNVLHITFRSDHSVEGLGFEFSWNSTDPVCGELIDNRTHGSIRSPGFPGRYPHDRDCVWQISVSWGKRIQLVFATFQIETHPNCSYDYLEIRDGLEDTAPVLEKLCNTTVPAPVTSSGPFLNIRFHTDDSDSDEGFLITFTEIPGIPGCGGLLTSAMAVFSSPHHPEPYAHGLECDWLIRLPSSDDRIRLTFLSFELEESYYRTNCVYDYIEIHDGPTPGSPLIGRFCGTSLPPSFVSRTNQLFVKFKSDESIAMGGFSAKYETVCGGLLTAMDGVLRSPYYPSNYPKLRDCVYVISIPAGKGIQLQFLDFDIESGHDTSCYFDYLEIRDGDNENSTLIGHFCGPPQSAPEVITSSFNYLWVRFKTDGSIQNRGFLANYSSFDTGCGGILRNSEGTISSPGHPEIYPHGVRCMWVIRGEPGQIVRITWDVFSLEGGTTCRYDSIEIYDNSTASTNGSFVGRYCGQEHPPIITSSDTTLTVIFKSDHSVAHDGFMASYKLLNATTVCGGQYFTEYGVIKSPRYPDNYPNTKSCTWVITVPRGRQIELNFTDFDMEDATSSGCRYDYLEIRNGAFVTSPLIGKFCGNRPPPQKIPSFTNSMFLKFKSDSSHTRKGFNIVWDGTSTGCGGTVTSPSGSIASPNYPSSAGSGMECVWKIHINQGSALQLSFVDVDVQHTSSRECWGDHVEILDGPSRNSRSLGRFCSEDHAVSLQSTGSSVIVKFITRFGGAGRGFQLNYRSECNRVIEGFEGVIESPYYPNPYPHNRNCTWTIQASRGNKVNMSFSHFDIEGPYRGNCSYDFVQISEWKRHEQNKAVLGTYCGSNRPRLISSTKDTVSVSFVSDYSHASNGFRMEWKQYGCGGRIIGAYGTIQSPDYPNRYPHDVECVWKVTTEVGTKVRLTVQELDIERGHDRECYFDGLEVFGGPDKESPLLSRLCESTTSATVVTSHGNNMYIWFFADSSIAHRGFSGYIAQVSGGCGGSFRGTAGYIYSPNYPQNYDHNEDCLYYISVDRNHAVELTFEEFDVEFRQNCTYDYVAVYDGLTIDDSQLLMHCGNQLPNPQVIRSTGNQMLVRLRTDDSLSGKGFKVFYKQGCGARLVGRQNGVITSPNFPRHLDYLTNCSWIIEGSTPDDRVSFTFTHLDLGEGSSETVCDDRYIEVVDGEDPGAPSLYKACSGSAPPTLTSRGNLLVLRVMGYFPIGFRATYDMSTSACGGELTAPDGAITSPNYPTGYPPNIQCIWVIKASPGNQVQLSFRRFALETSDFCNSDFVEIHEGSSSGKLLGHFCGNEIPSNVTAANRIWILFRTDSEGQAPGFWADFTIVHGMELSGPSGSIGSPMFPLMYTKTGDFTWRVTVNESYAVQITFSHYEFDVYDDDCTYYDTISIYDGYDEDSPVLLSTCARQKPDPVISTGNVVYIVYNLRGYHSNFLLRWQQIQGSFGGAGSVQTNITGCGGNFSLVDNNATTLISPGFPYGYSPNLNCVWNFDAPKNSRIQLKVATMALESYSGCNLDKVELYDGVRGLPNYELNRTICLWSERNATYTSSGRFLRVAFLTDGNYFSSGFNFTLTTLCGGYVRDSRGTISSPNYPNNYVMSNCLWFVVVRPGRTIRVTFNSVFGIYSGGGECVTDQLILRNGHNDESPFLGSGRYCGNTAPPTLETTGNHLFVHFTAWTQGAKGFALTYEEVSLGCGGNVQLSDSAPTTIIQSPNFPSIPLPYTECEWIFTAPQGEAVQVTFQVSFELTIAPGCQNAGVEVRDGGTAIASELGVFCRDMPGTLTSTGNVLYVRYYTNVPEPRSGFKAEVKIATCGGIHTGRSGIISSPGFPATYAPNLDCLWTIKAPVGSYIIVEFLNFNLGSSDTNCTKDKVNITEQSDPDIITPRNWTFCGDSSDNIPNRVQSGSNEIQIRFVSDGQAERQVSGIGFKLRYRSRQQSCGGSLRTPTGFIQSPGFPQPYPHYLYCVWRIYAVAGRRIRIEFSDFDLEEKLTSTSGSRPQHSCFADQLWIYQGVMRNFRLPLYNQSICGSVLPQPVETTSSEATIYFRTDGSIAHRGFKLSYTTDLPAICGGTLDPGRGNITSPNVTTISTPTTTSNILCEWTAEEGLHNGTGTTIVTIQRLRIPSWGERDPICSHGFLRVAPMYSRSYRGYSYSYSFVRYKWRKLCGSFDNEKLYLPGGNPLIEFVAEDLNASFSLSYETVPCGGVLSGPEDNITSLNYPAPYAPNIECIWMIEYNYGTQVKVKFLEMDMDGHQGAEGCDNDYIIIRNGKYPSSPSLGKFCGTDLPPDITSMSHELWIEFHSDGNADGSKHGFQLSLETVSRGCGGVVHRKYGQLQGPLDATSRRYPDNAECEWIIESVPGYTVNIVFFDRFEIENSTNCTNDYVEILQKVQFDWIPLARHCGRQLPPSINTTGTSVKVIFKSNENLNGDGFRLYWYSPCGGVFKEPTGIIRSAHFDTFNHSQHANPGRFWSFTGWESTYKVSKCDYEIPGNATDFIMMKFLEPFEIIAPTFAVSEADLNMHCPSVNVSVWQGTPTQLEFSTGYFCGRQIPPPMVVRGGATISYNYRASFENYGFRLEYARFECGGEITTERTIRSPGSPFTSAANTNCTWVVRAPQNKVVRFKFKFLEVEYQRQCSYDSIRLYDGTHIDDSKLIGTYCGNLTSEIPRIISKLNTLTVQFTTDGIIHHGGFEGAIDFSIGEQQGCGGIKNITRTPITLTSPDVDRNGKYDDNLDCQWLLVAPEFESIEVSFTAFNLEDSQGGNKVAEGNCPLDFLEIRDGPGPHALLLAKLCGSTIPSPVFSSTNFMWIRFSTDGTINFSGFTLSVKSRESPCGHLVLNATRTVQYLESPGSPSNYDNNVRCRWRITGESYFNEVDITFIQMDIEAASDCQKDRLEIRDAADSYTSPEGITGTMFTGTAPVDWRFRRLNLTMDMILQDMKYCGNQLPPDFFTVGRSAEVVFESDGSTTGRGFKLAYKAAGCNRTYENVQGRVFSSEWPTSPPIFSNCLSSIRAPNGSTIALYFNSFGLNVASGQTGCSEAALEIRDGGASGAMLAQYCGSAIPNPVFSQTSTLFLKFFSRMHPNRGYDITYTTTEMGRGCGGNIFHTGGSFTSPMYPGNYSTNSDCRWRVRVPGGLRIQIEFTNFMFGGDCSSDFVEISAVDSHDASQTPILFSKYCSTDVPAIYLGNTDTAIVRYKTSVNNTGSGWRATFKGVFPSRIPVGSIEA